MSNTKSITVTKNDDTVYVPVYINNASTAYKASLHILLKHFADVHHTILKVVSDKYDIPFEEMLMTVMEDPEYQSTMENPIVSSLTYISQEDVTKTTDKPKAVDKPITDKPKAIPLKKRKAPIV